MSTFVRQSPGLPSDWSEPGLAPRPGILPRLSTIDPNSPDQRAKRALLEAASWAETGRQRNLVSMETVGPAVEAFNLCRQLVDSQAQIEMRAKARLAGEREIAAAGVCEIWTVEGLETDRGSELCHILERGLKLMAGSVACRVDWFKARDYERGCFMVAWALKQLVPEVQGGESAR